MLFENKLYFKNTHYILGASLFILCIISSCTNPTTAKSGTDDIVKKDTINISEEVYYVPDTNDIPNTKYGDMVRYGKDLFYQTGFLIGPEGKMGKYGGNKLDCNSCHQDGGTKPFSFSLINSHKNYPQYRSREAKVLSMAERVNNCINRPLNGKSLPLDSREMIAFISYIQWLGIDAPDKILGEKPISIELMDRAADPDKGKILYAQHCQRCHQEDGSGQLNADNTGYQYPPLWGEHAYQPGSSMHRVIMQAKWIKANMPQDMATWDKPILTDEEALDISAYVNDDRIHKRPNPITFDYPNKEEKAIDYDKGPFFDNFTELEHKYGPYKPIIEYWKSKGLKPTY